MWECQSPHGERQGANLPGRTRFHVWAVFEFFGFRVAGGYDIRRHKGVRFFEEFLSAEIRKRADFWGLEFLNGRVRASVSNVSFSVNGFSLKVPSQSGRVYQLQYKNSSDDASWTSLPLVAGSGKMIKLTDGTAGNSKQRIYPVLRWRVFILDLRFRIYAVR